MKNFKQINIVIKQRLQKIQNKLNELNNNKAKLSLTKQELIHELKEANTIMNFKPELISFYVNYTYNIRNKIQNIEKEIETINKEIELTIYDLQDSFIENKKLNIYINQELKKEKIHNINKQNKKLDDLINIKLNNQTL